MSEVDKRKTERTAPRKETWQQRKERAASEHVEEIDDVKGKVRKLFAVIAKEVRKRR